MIDEVLERASVRVCAAANGTVVAMARTVLQKKTGPVKAPLVNSKQQDQSLCQVWLLQISPPSTQPLILSEVPDSVALPE